MNAPEHLVCPACLRRGLPGGWLGLARHLTEEAARSDAGHIRWLNQNLTPKREAAEAIARRLEELYAAPNGVGAWVKQRFIGKFFGTKPHPFVQALQHPSRAVLLGYVVEHQHFLRQWVRSCAFILARSDDPDVARYEIDNLNTEFGGIGTSVPAHYELLLRMGEALGVDRTRVLAAAPLPRTRDAISAWDAIARDATWPAAMAAMHALELIAHRNLVREGASVHYFDPSILEGHEIPDAAKAFLREGYEADVGHSELALALVERTATTAEARAEVQSTFLRSADLFDDYLMARLERAEEFEAA
ncbi:MAG TPA: iron-containing redox enzyme family protein [Thermoplasmata archaeon]|nr:iron-containing redox enzyme family protein [Thermoplasmata archaeon]